MMNWPGCLSTFCYTGSLCCSSAPHPSVSIVPHVIKSSESTWEVPTMIRCPYDSATDAASEPLAKLEFGWTTDDAWYLSRLQLEDETIRTIFIKFPENDDDSFLANQFVTATAIEEFRGRFKYELVPMEGEIVVEGTLVYAYNKSATKLEKFSLLADMAGMVSGGSQFDTHQYDTRKNELLTADEKDGFAAYNELHESFDANLQENLLRGIYAYDFEKNTLQFSNEALFLSLRDMMLFSKHNQGPGKLQLFV